MHGLVVGRFQPLHKGHAALIKAAVEDCVNVTVGIGSSNAPQNLQNPFSFEERRRMLGASFPGIRVLAIPDIHDPPRWVDHVLDITGPVDRAYGNDTRTLDLFEDAGVPVRRPGMVQREQFEASTVRMQMAEDDGAWRRAVPPAVVEVLDAIEAGKRLRLLEARA